ncbi:hypothetical protein K458DRAFT_407050 [Lentithecium fluviatile CBS 122367]|uniref:Uncharacterized protein n=1 Tax=Lentithecium fluviatile CBS 122367 TaxID=1168545 RepID=A0A6G1IRN9_9PLEO|nr:hypothetical protein K458DRAFT_407050 [Lentithecium fluviatile CBS 122367]
MPAILHTNTSFSSGLSNHMPQPDPKQELHGSELQTILFNNFAIMLAAATLIVACLHFRHQRKQNGQEPGHDAENTDSFSSFAIGERDSQVERVLLDTTSPSMVTTHTEGCQE